MDSENDKPPAQKPISGEKNADDADPDPDAVDNSPPKAEPEAPPPPSDPKETTTAGDDPPGSDTAGAKDPKPRPSPAPPDLKKVSEEIRQYISTLSSSSGGSAPPDVPVFVEQFAVLVEAKVEDYSSRQSGLSGEHSASFLESTHLLSSLSRALSHFSSEYQFSYPINCVGAVLHRAVTHLEDEFKALLEDHRVPSNQEREESEEKNKSNPPADSDEATDFRDIRRRPYRA